MINIRKLNGNDLSNYYTKSQCDSKFLQKMDLSTVINDLQTQITTLDYNTNTHLTTLDGIVTSQNSQINDLNNFSTLIDLNLYKPLLNSGDTRINNLSGLSDYIDSKIGGGSTVSIDKLAIDPFWCIGNFNTSISLTHVVNFSNMVLNNINTHTALTSLKNISFGKCVFQNQSSFGGSGGVANTSVVSRSCRMFDFYLDLTALTNFNSNNNMVMIFVPDKILNLNDGYVYSANYITNSPTAVKFNNSNITNMYLLFRDHINMNNSIFKNLFLAGTDSFAATKLHLCFLSRIKLLNPTTRNQPTLTTYKVYLKPCSRLWNRCCGLMIKNLYYIPTLNGNIYNLDVCLSLWNDYEKTVDNLYLGNPDIYNYGGFVTVSGNTIWKQYHTQQSSMDYYTTNVPILLTNSDSTDAFFQFLNSLYH